MKRVFFVDTENTNNYDFILNYRLDSDDLIYLLYTDKSKFISIDKLRVIMSFEGLIEFIEVSRGTHNELDFQLTALLGATVGTYGNSVDYFIVSSDRGFVAPMLMLKSMYDVNISIVKEEKKWVDSRFPIEHDLVQDWVSGNIQVGIRDDVLGCVSRSRSMGELHMNLVSTLGNTGKSIYNEIWNYCQGG